MKITLGKKQIRRIIAAASTVISRRCTLPVLEHLLVSVQAPDRMTVTATDLEQTLVLTVEPESPAEPGSCLVPLAELKDQDKALKGSDTLTLEVAEDGSVELTSATAAGSITRAVAGVAVDEFPAIPKRPELKGVDAGAFLHAFRCAAVSASTDVARTALMGVYADAEKHVLVSTDGKRLTRLPVADLPLDTSAIIPVTRALLKLLPASGACEIGLAGENDDPVFVIEAGDILYAVKCVAGTYPNYERVIPDRASLATAFAFSDAALASVAALAPHLKKDGDREVFVAGRNGQLAAGIQPESGCSALLIADGNFEGSEAVTFGVNCGFLQDALNNGFLNLRMADRLTPLLFTNSDGGEHLIMPLQAEPSAELMAKFDAILGPVGAETAVDEPTAAEPEAAAQEASSQPGPAEQEIPKMTRATQKSETRPPRPDLKVVGREDPLDGLDALVTESQDALRQADVAVRELRKQVRAVKTHYRNREKEISSREKEMERNLTVISKLQQSIAA